MSHVLSRHHSGLLVAHDGVQEASVRRALKGFDGRLMLDHDIDPEWQRIVYRVLCRVASDRPPVPVCSWRDEHGCPLPLSHGLVEKVKHLHMNSRVALVDVEADNDELRERQRAEDREEIAGYAAELHKRLKGTSGPILPRGRYRRNTQFGNVTDVR